MSIKKVALKNAPTWEAALSSVSFLIYNVSMIDETFHGQMFNIFCKDYQTRDYPIDHPIKALMWDHVDFIDTLVSEGKCRSAVQENVERMLLCRTVYLGFDLFECPNCGNESMMPRCCHSRFCNSCGVKYSKQLALKATHMCLDVSHRHVVFTIPDSMRNWFRQDRSRINLLFIAARNTIASLVNQPLYKKLKRKLKKIKNQYYLYQDHRHARHFGMIASLHTFGRDLKWNPHIHVLIPEMIYDKDKDKDKLIPFTHFDYTKLRKTFQFELLRLMEEKIGPSFKKHKNQYFENYKDGLYVYAKKMDSDDTDADINEDHSDNIKGCINYCMRYAGRPAMAESRITEYDRLSKKVKWFYHDHKDEKRYDVEDDAETFVKKLIMHIPDKYFHTVRYFGFYSNASSKELDHLHELLGNQKKKNYTKEVRKAKQEAALEKLHYRTHLIDSFNRDPLKCTCGHILQHIETYNPLEKRKNDNEYRKECINEMRRMQIPRNGPCLGPRRTGRVLN
ncbi:MULTISPECIES: transposase [unclassified Breznakia]|uniref:transposase n=1 Tax=unclassified Breznakia TaxID=2623764 RepID=UPI0024730686|nr:MULTISPECIES: transposase [unclassified Breznakia]MDH6366845.1 hypothetical protein [Breznakia sp. PH1-1]MDH6404023.1 hypothetical protein [Breznakia sp. PF1-11]MDH6411755.1 hypothetical protein [Breznakia sp. PFB1-11]MDH6414011.1 hypothetical protein [Breznakia sp. PFB1-14]MDH6416441.1 hypothetical protein [Breznakia sp. PFB1-4]